MKFSIPVAVLYLTTGAYSYVAAPPATRTEYSPPTIVERDLATAKSVLADVKTGFSAISSAASVFNGDPAPLKSAADSLLTKVDSDTVVVKNMTPLSFFDCIGIISPAKDLVTQGKALGDQLKSKKADVEKYKQCGTLYDFLNKGYLESQILITAIVSKVPSSLQGTVQDQGNDISQTLKDARDAFAPGSCTDAS